ncbi:MAG: type II secretion system protein [Candidatus Omnitrophica bacterium]|nr:type II secretion system protein [Candidatus Omnitrophota bacterium]
MNKRGVTLLELLIVVIIIGVLATLATVSYTGIKEDTVDKEAKANLRLILAAQRIYRMELGVYYQAADTGEINTNLRLVLPTGGTPNWNYITTANAGTTCCGQATRNIPGGKNWRKRYPETVPDIDLGTCP